jgi:hypothetical protein
MTVERGHLIDVYRRGHAAIMACLRDLAAVDLDRSPPGEWSTRQIIHHLADTEVWRSARLRRLLTQDDPVIQAFDEVALAGRGKYLRDPAASLALFDACTRSTLEILALLSDADFEKAGTHTEYGHFTVDMLLERAADHLTEHAAQLRGTLTS